MEHVTVRRWVAMPPDAIYRRLCDLDQLVADDPALELVEPPLIPGELHPGDHFVMRHQRGRRLTRLRVEIASARAPELLVARMTTRSTSWTLDVSLTPLDDGLTDLQLHARLDGHRPRAVQHRVVEGVEALLEGLAHHAERTTTGV